MADIIVEIGIWVAAAYTLMIYSYPYKDTPLFKFAEHTMIGLGIAITTIMGIRNILDIAVGSIVNKGEIAWIVPILLGLALFTRYSRQYAWLSRWPLALLVGVGIGVSMGSSVDASFLAQIRSTVTGVNTLNKALLGIMIIITITYFIFSIGKEQREKGAFKYTSQLGRYVMMLCFGALFGNTIMTRMALFIGRMNFLLFEWLKLG
ncbi:MAG: hypothetical protein OEZ44_03990 [Candidatus Bathyarchaeota archaeon]|nr:hypothetical protein [Candidatus Bathyarchaeota archaeon]